MCTADLRYIPPEKINTLQKTPAKSLPRMICTRFMLWSCFTQCDRYRHQENRTARPGGHEGRKDIAMATTAAPTRYTINLDGTLEKWYLEHDGGEIIYLRKTPRPKWNCGMKEFPAAEVFPDYKTARAVLKARASAKIAP
jgi:hypothetical protein